MRLRAQKTYVEEADEPGVVALQQFGFPRAYNVAPAVYIYIADCRTELQYV